MLGHLDTWDKLLVVAGAVAALGLAVFLLVCCVGDGCLLHDLIKRCNTQAARMKFYNHVEDPTDIITRRAFLWLKVPTSD